MLPSLLISSGCLFNNLNQNHNHFVGLVPFKIAQETSKLQTHYGTSREPVNYCTLQKGKGGATQVLPYKKGSIKSFTLSCGGEAKSFRPTIFPFCSPRLHNKLQVPYLLHKSLFNQNKADQCLRRLNSKWSSKQKLFHALHSDTESPSVQN